MVEGGWTGWRDEATTNEALECSAVQVPIVDAVSGQRGCAVTRDAGGFVVGETRTDTHDHVLRLPDQQETKQTRPRLSWSWSWSRQDRTEQDWAGLGWTGLGAQKRVVVTQCVQGWPVIPPSRLCAAASSSSSSSCSLLPLDEHMQVLARHMAMEPSVDSLFPPCRLAPCRPFSSACDCGLAICQSTTYLLKYIPACQREPHHPRLLMSHFST